MAFLVVGGVTVKVARASPPSGEYEEWGDKDRSFTRAMLFIASGAAPRKRVWRNIVTKPMTSATANTLETALLAAPPVSCSGDVLGGTVSCFPEIHSRSFVGEAAAQVEVLVLSLEEA